MPTFSQTVYVDVDMADLEIEELIEEVESRGYVVKEINEVPDFDIVDVELYWNQGNRKEALILLERKFPELIGISKLGN